jgi:PKD repeat protein
MYSSPTLLPRLLALSILITFVMQPLFAVPPVATFAYNNTDTLWINSPSTLQNTSSNADFSYWDIAGYNATDKFGTYAGFSVARQCINHHNVTGCFLDTVKHKGNLNRYVFTQPGFYRLRLVAVNDEGQDTYFDTIYVDTPSAPPVAEFLLDRRIIGVYDFANVYDLSSNGPATWKWYVDPPFYNPGAPFFNSFSPTATSQDVQLNANEGGIYDICLVVTNARGSDTLCKQDHIRIIAGYEGCKGTSTDKDTMARENEGSVRLATVSDKYIPSLIGTCGKGFTIAACSDTVLLYIERLKLRDSDSLKIHVGDINGSVVARFGGHVIPPGYTTVTVPDGIAYLETNINPLTGTGDSGYVVRWSSAPPAFTKPNASFSIPDTIWSGTTVYYDNTSTGKHMKYAWDSDGDNVFGLDNPSAGMDFTTENPSKTFTGLVAPQLRNICLKVSNCVGSDTACKAMWTMPVTTIPYPSFTVNATSGFTPDTFRFTDHTTNGVTQWQWTFSPNNVVYINGTNANSQHPEVLLYNPTTYTVTLTATNNIGSNSITKTNYITILSYPVPGCSGCPIVGGFPVLPPITDIGISRVILDEIDTFTALNTPIYHALQNYQSTTVYRGASYTLMTARGTASDPMDTRAWIDFNRNTNFGDQPSEVITNTNNQTQLLTSSLFTVPSNAGIGTTRLRIGVTYGNTAITYQSAALGCFEDYGIRVGIDHVKPVVTLIGNAVEITEIHKPYIEKKVVAIDNIEGDISSRYEVIGTVDTGNVGYYALKYIARDYYDNVSDTVIRNVQVVLNYSGPTLTLNGGDTTKIEVYHSFHDSGAIALTNTGTDISSFIQVTGKPDTAQTGLFPVTYSITDQFGFNVTKIRWVLVHDTTRPVITTLTGADSILHQLGDPYLDPVKATDNYCMNMIVIRDSSTKINLAIPGTYYLLYHSTDCSGNKADDIIIKVIVKDRIPPSATLNGPNPMIVDVHTTFTDPWVTATDNYPPIMISTSGNVNMHLLGTDSIVYTIKDAAGNITRLTRVVVKVDREIPVLELLGSNPYVVICHTPYIDPGVKIKDNYYTDAEIRGAGFVIDLTNLNMDVEGLYIVTYQATDPSGNVSTKEQRFVHVICPPDALDELYENSNITLFPNPGKGRFTVGTKNKADISGLKIADMQGRIVYSRQGINTPDIEIDITDAGKGLYLIMLEDADHNWYTTKAMVE